MILTFGNKTNLIKYLTKTPSNISIAIICIKISINLNLKQFIKISCIIVLNHKEINGKKVLKQ
jgi:hypothetical protein